MKKINKLNNNKIAFFPTPQSIVNIMINLINNNHYILDSGFGEGAFLFSFNKNNFKKIIGVELNNDFFNKAVLKLNNKNKNDKEKKYNLYCTDYLSFSFNEKIQTIIGNPPYITNDNLLKNIKNNIINITKTGEGNIYYAFIIKSIELLEDNGELIYILPYDFFYNTYAKYLREYMIKNGEFILIIDFNELKIFKNASPEVIIFKYIKRKNKLNNHINIIKYNNISNKTDIIIEDLNNCLNHKENTLYWNNFDINQFSNNDNIFYTDYFKVFEKSKKLSDFGNSYVGIVSGKENVFKINNDFYKKNINSIFIKKFIKAKDLEDNTLNEKLLNNYIFIPDYISEDILKKEDNNIYKYLYHFKEDLSNRYNIKNNKKWFHYSSVRNIKIIEKYKNKYKILCPNITRKKDSWFSLTNSNSLISGDILMIIGNTDDITFYLFGILNSDYFKNYYSKIGAKKGKRIILNQGLLKNILIPDFNEYIKEEIIDIIKRGISNNYFEFDRINLIINKELFDYSS